MESTTTNFALCGRVRADGEADDSMNRLCTKAGCKSKLGSFRENTDGLDLVLKGVWSPIQ